MTEKLLCDLCGQEIKNKVIKIKGDKLAGPLIYDDFGYGLLKIELTGHSIFDTGNIGKKIDICQDCLIRLLKEGVDYEDD